MKQLLQTLTVIAASLMLAGCLVSMLPSNIPDTPAGVLSDITVETDEFTNETWISTYNYWTGSNENNTLASNIRLRAHYKQDELAFIQLVISRHSVDWIFYNRAVGEDGYEFELVDIDKRVTTTFNTVGTAEIIGLTIPKDYLHQMSQQDWKIKIYGKRMSGIFTVPKQMSSAFLEKIDSI